MRKVAPLLFACTFVVIAAADETPQSFLGMLPDLPDQTCQTTPQAREAYRKRLADVRKPLELEIKRRKQLQAAGDRERKKAMPKLTKEQREALADKMLQDKLNLSLDEIKRLKQLSKEGRRAWAGSLATEQMAVGAADPDAAKADQEKNFKMIDLANELRLRESEFAAAAGKYATQFSDLSKEFEDERAEHNREEAEEAKQRAATNSSDSAGPVQKNYHYCDRYSPRYLEIAVQYRRWVLGVLPACTQLEKLEYEMLKATTDQANAIGAGNLPAVPLPPEPAYDGGTRALAVIRDCLKVLEDAYRYDVDPRPEQGGTKSNP